MEAILAKIALPLLPGRLFLVLTCMTELLECELATVQRVIDQVTEQVSSGLHWLH